MSASFQRSDFCVSPSSSVRDAAACIERNTAKIALVVDDEGRLLDTITDGDIRRALLAGLDRTSSVGSLRETKGHIVRHQPISAPADTDPAALLRLMRDHGVKQIPLLDAAHRVVNVVSLDSLVETTTLPVRAVIMAGGFGRRLAPLTDDVPKPMLPVGDRPLLELIVERLRTAGVRQVTLLTHYKSEYIADHFQDGSAFGVAIDYINEEEPLGTAGALTLLPPCNEPLLVMNGDILTRLDFGALLDFHHQQRASITVAVREYDFRVPYGVVETDGVQISGISEKPVVRYFVNAGIYLVDPAICGLIPRGSRCDMPTLINAAIARNHRAASFLIHEYWLDIGHMDDYRKAVTDHRNGVA